MNVRPYNNKQRLLFPASIGDFLPDDDEVHVIDDIVDSLDLSCIYNKLSKEGNPSYDPRMMLKVLFYAYSQGIYSSRKIMRKLERDVGFIYLAGMQKPDFRTICEFRRKHLNELRELFVQIVGICVKMGLVSLEHVSIDGTVVKADANDYKSYTEEQLEEEMEKIKSRLGEYLEKAVEVDEEEDAKYGEDRCGDEIPEDLRDKRKRLEKLEEIMKKLKAKKRSNINTTDEDAVLQKDKKGMVAGYRGEVAVDSKDQVILAVDVVNKSVDREELIPMSKQVLENTKDFRENRRKNKKIKVGADSGFSSGRNLEEAEKIEEMEFYIPDSNYEGKRRGKKSMEYSPFYVDKFKYDKERDEYICPAGKRLRYMRQDKRKDHKVRVYKCDREDCLSCEHFGKCTTDKNGRHLRINPYREYFLRMRERLSTDEGRRVYKLRSQVVETVFGHIKYNLGFRRFHLRGLKKARGEFTLMAIVHNISKITRFVKKRFKEGIKNKSDPGMLRLELCYVR